MRTQQATIIANPSPHGHKRAVELETAEGPRPYLIPDDDHPGVPVSAVVTVRYEEGDQFAYICDPEQKTKFKVWVQVEKVNAELDIFENQGEPDEAGCFDNLDDAQNFAAWLTSCPIAPTEF